MENPITDKLKETLKEQSEKLKDDKKVKEFEEASEEFDKLVESGIISKRGYTLLSIDEAHLRRSSFNTK